MEFYDKIHLVRVSPADMYWKNLCVLDEVGILN